MEKYVAAFILSFFIYGFSGWIWESFICPLLTGHHIKNSGFLNGPIVPIYGVGALAVILLFSSQETILSVFLEGAVVACVIEYITSWMMEKLYHRRWWDYSDKAFQVNGRICLEGFLVFGLFSVVTVKWIQPLLMQKLLKYSMISLVVVATILSTLLVVDFITTVISLTQLEVKLDRFVKDLQQYFEGDKINTKMAMRMLKAKDKALYKEFTKKHHYIHKRVIHAFPHLTSKQKGDRK